MKTQFVKNSNWQTFATAVTTLDNRGSKEASIILLHGEPGTGKSRAVDRFGSDRNGVYLQGMPDMTVSFTTDYLADRLCVKEARAFAKYNAIIKSLHESQSPIILDEAQHAAIGKAKPLEYLRRVAEQANVLLVLVCHTSERHLFNDNRMAHINTRITSQPKFQLANAADVAHYLQDLCEVSVDDVIAEQVRAQSEGRYRLINNAIKSLEAIAAQKGKSALSGADVKGVKLCQDVMKQTEVRK
ncbi:Bacteriophage DNA transposition B protein [Ferriphaselus amnicola]|uniref:Bacteriophage DNA transposition B protein n=1 Tax=Ferriphaselus amnicola TaxID=1188319 RepID=A0A2Z6GC35_9PROT|nr:ATP-binding protein [Ferriphaselus amnicola]BBE51181.1 Bacteriophage DNA transposition B protein [Ferriphaselus amnicola]